MAFASTKMPGKPPGEAATERAVSSAACGGQMDRISPAREASSATEVAADSPAPAARAAVAALRPAGAHSTG